MTRGSRGGLEEGGPVGPQGKTKAPAPPGKEEAGARIAERLAPPPPAFVPRTGGPGNGAGKITMTTRQRRKTAQRAVRDYRNCWRQLKALQQELDPLTRREWVERDYNGQFERFVESPSSPLSSSLDWNGRRSLRRSQRIIRRYDIMLKRAHTLSLKAVASLERLQRVMRPREAVRDVLRGRRASTH
jgi:hypothetical protein